ncbi:MAG: hypothetical protein SFV24_01105 [Gemmatimonadales bacterium]|nr:hypothetical protein [Gemmatimonadales bacterium]
MSAEQPRDWDKEMAEIDKIIAKTPPAQLGSGASGPPAPAKGGGAAAPARAAAPPTGRAAVLATWVRVGLGVALGIGMTQWPYFHACGTSLFIYLGAVGVVGISGLWGMVSSWRRRMGLAHSVSLAVLLWSGVLAAATVLPRVGYAKRAATWICP